MAHFLLYKLGKICEPSKACIFFETFLRKDALKKSQQVSLSYLIDLVKNLTLPPKIWIQEKHFNFLKTFSRYLVFVGRVRFGFNLSISNYFWPQKLPRLSYKKYRNLRNWQIWILWGKSWPKIYCSIQETKKLTDLYTLR